MRFEAKGQEYLLAFVEEEKRFYLFAPTPAGIQRFPVYVDSARWSAGSAAELNQLAS